MGKEGLIIGKAGTHKIHTHAASEMQGRLQIALKTGKEYLTPAMLSFVLGVDAVSMLAFAELKYEYNQKGEHEHTSFFRKRKLQYVDYRFNVYERL